MTEKIAVLQMTSGIDPAINAENICAAMERASQQGASILFTPEMAGLLDRDRKRAAAHIVPESGHPFLRRMSQCCADNSIALQLGSLPILHEDELLRNRSFLFDRVGNIAGRYDKMHLFDVTLGDGDDWRESSTYGAGDSAILVETGLGRMGMTICYDLRFAGLYSLLAANGADIITVPAAFTVPTGKAHWHVMLRARAIECQCFIVAAAQVGRHEDGRQTYGHSLVIDPWGEILLDMESNQSLGYAELDMDRISEVRRKLPAISNRREMPASVRLLTNDSI